MTREKQKLCTIIKKEINQKSFQKTFLSGDSYNLNDIIIWDITTKSDYSYVCLKLNNGSYDTFKYFKFNPLTNRLAPLFDGKFDGKTKLKTKDDFSFYLEEYCLNSDSFIINCQFNSSPPLLDAVIENSIENKLHVNVFSDGLIGIK